MSDSRRCSFCCLEPSSTLTVLGGPGDNTICSECIAFCEEIIEDDRRFSTWKDDRRFSTRTYVSPGMLARVEELPWLELEAAEWACTAPDEPEPNEELACAFCRQADATGRDARC